MAGGAAALETLYLLVKRNQITRRIFMTTNTSSIQDSHVNRNNPPDEDEMRALAGVLQRIVQNAGALLEVSSCSVVLTDATGCTVVTHAVPDLWSSTRHTRFQLNEGVTGWVAQYRIPLVINDTRLDPRFKPPGEMPTGSMICIPLVDHNEFIGTLTASSPAVNAFSARQLQVLAIFAEQAVLAIVNARRASQLHTVLTASSEGFAIIGDDGRFLQANPAYGEMFAVDLEQLTGAEAADLFSCNDDCSHESCGSLRTVQQALQQRQALPYTEIDLLINGASRSIGVSITPVPAGDRPLSLMIARDVTAIRDAVRARSKFLSMIAHELRSPLNAIHGYLDLVLDDIAGPVNEQQREFIQRARSGSEHLYALLEDLLIIARADSGQLHLNREEASLEEIITSAREELEITAIDNGISIDIDIDADFPPIYVDGIRVQQVLRNLLSNALRFTPSGGDIAVSARVRYSEPASPQETQKEWVEVRVRDSGIGISPPHQLRIFERFYQVPRSEGGRSTGQGLGLAIVKMIVELHGGQVLLESIPSRGSTFIFTLPCLQP